MEWEFLCCDDDLKIKIKKFFALRSGECLFMHFIFLSVLLSFFLSFFFYIYFPHCCFSPRRALQPIVPPFRVPRERDLDLETSSWQGEFFVRSSLQHTLSPGQLKWFPPFGVAACTGGVVPAVHISVGACTLFMKWIDYDGSLFVVDTYMYVARTLWTTPSSWSTMGYQLCWLDEEDTLSRG